jgi:hypothetical protein
MVTDISEVDMWYEMQDISSDFLAERARLMKIRYPF